jgi:hypothetical protein
VSDSWAVLGRYGSRGTLLQPPLPGAGLYDCFLTSLQQSSRSQAAPPLGTSSPRGVLQHAPESRFEQDAARVAESLSGMVSAGRGRGPGIRDPPGLINVEATAPNLAHVMSDRPEVIWLCGLLRFPRRTNAGQEVVEEDP